MEKQELIGFILRELRDKRDVAWINSGGGSYSDEMDATFQRGLTHGYYETIDIIERIVREEADISCRLVNSLEELRAVADELAEKETDPCYFAGKSDGLKEAIETVTGILNN
jgi:hypothetical protein